MDDLATFDRAVRLEVYRQFVETGRAPSPASIARAVGSTELETQHAYHRLADGRILVLRSGTSEILMANPLSAVPTAFRVEADGRSFWGNCVWDALGVLAMLHTDGRVTTACGDCDERMVLQVKASRLVAPSGIIHFQVPAAHWWDDIVFT